MTKFLIVGLGVIGASFAKSLRDLGYIIYGIDNDEFTINYAIEYGFVDFASNNIKDFIDLVDIIIICLYPNDIIKILEDNEFKTKQIIADVSGVKENLIEQINKLNLKAEYISLHPMAGREKKGIIYADKTRFYDANFLIVPTNHTTKRSIDIFRNLAYQMKFSNIKVIDSKYHDYMISKTSQLPHILAVALVLADNDSNTLDFIGDSYRDLTRIAMINGDLWCELFKENKINLLKNIENFQEKLDNIKDFLKQDNYESLKEMFKESTIKRELMNRKR